jgi:predicted permease
VDPRVLLFTLAVSLVSGVLFGLAPALAQPRAEALAGWRSLGTRHDLFRHALVAAQICASLVLLTGASLLLRSLWNLQNQPLGMRTDSVLTAAITLGQKSYSEPVRQLAFFEELETRLSRLPGVTALALSDSVPPIGPARSTIYSVIDVAGRPRAAEGTGGMVTWRSVTPGYFAALGVPILRGRGFEENDRDPQRNVVVISDTLARRMFPGEDALGKQIQPGRSGPWLTIVGVAGNVKNTSLAERDDPEFYVVRKHSPDNATRWATAILRGAVDPGAMARWVRTEVAALDPTLPVNIETLDQRVGKLAERPRFNALLLGLFAGMGLLLAAIGLYGVMSFLVAQRTQEIGVRMALGATPAVIARLVLGHAARWTAAGAVAGTIGSMFAVRLLRAMLFHVSGKDPWTWAAAVAVLLAIAMLAAWIPSRRAARVDPMQALRQE